MAHLVGFFCGGTEESRILDDAVGDAYPLKFLHVDFVVGNPVGEPRMKHNLLGMIFIIRTRCRQQPTSVTAQHQTLHACRRTSFLAPLGEHPIRWSGSLTSNARRNDSAPGLTR